jgi:hypothetical protein
VVELSAQNLLEEVVAALLGGCGAAGALMALMAVWAPSGGYTCMVLRLTVYSFRSGSGNTDVLRLWAVPELARMLRYAAMYSSDWIGRADSPDSSMPCEQPSTQPAKVRT